VKNGRTHYGNRDLNVVCNPPVCPTLDTNQFHNLLEI